MERLPQMTGGGKAASVGNCVSPISSVRELCNIRLSKGRLYICVHQVNSFARTSY